MVVLAAVGAAAALIRAVHPEAEAIVRPGVPLPAIALKAEQAVEEVARVQVEVKVVPGKNQVFTKGLNYKRIA